MIDEMTIMEQARLEADAAPLYLLLDHVGVVINVALGDPSDCVEDIDECDCCVPREGLAAEAGIGWTRKADGTFRPPTGGES